MKNQYNQVNMFTIRMTIILAMLISSIHTIAQEQVNLNFIEAVNRVLARNPNLASAEASLEASRANIAIAKSNYLPGLNILGSLSQSKEATFSQTAGVIPSSSALVGASLSQMVYNETYVANTKIQKYLFASDEELYRNTRNTTISAAGMSYIGLLFAIDLLEVQQENILITEQNLLASKDRLEVGSTDMQEVLRWELQFFSDRQAIESQKAAVIIRRGSLNQLLNDPIETKVYPEKMTLKNNGFIFSSEVVAALANDESKALIIRDYMVELGLANSPELASYDQQLLAQDRQLKADKRWAIPTFNFDASTNAKFALNEEDTEATDSDQGFWKFGITMLYPLVDGGANIKRVKQSKIQLSAMELQRNDLRNSIEQSIRASMAVVISDFLNIGFAAEQAEAAHKNYKLVYEAYYVGESSLLDLLDAQNQKLVADISSRVVLYTFFDDLLAVEQEIGFFPFQESEENVKEVIEELERRLLELP